MYSQNCIKLLPNFQLLMYILNGLPKAFQQETSTSPTAEW